MQGGGVREGEGAGRRDGIMSAYGQHSAKELLWGYKRSLACIAKFRARGLAVTTSTYCEIAGALLEALEDLWMRQCPTVKLHADGAASCPSADPAWFLGFLALDTLARQA